MAPPLVTLPPVAPDATNFAQMSQTGQAGTGVSAGPWFINGAWYTWLEPFAGQAVEVLKSSDGRATWSIVGGSSGLIEGPANAFYPGSGTVIYFVGVASKTANRPPLLQTFDASTDSYGGLSAPHPTINLFGTLTSILIKVQPGGTRWIVFAAGGAGTKVDYATWTAGVWGADTNVITANAIVPSDMAMEASGKIHCICQDQHGGPTVFDFYYFQISAGGVVGAPSIAWTVNPPDAVENGTSLMLLSGGKIFFPFSELVGADGIIEPFVLIGDSLVTPTWSVINLDPGGAVTIPSNSYEARDLVAAESIAGNATVFWDVIAFGVGGNSYIWLSTYNGATFGAPVSFFDSTVTPYPGQPASTHPPYQLSGMALQKSDGSWTLQTNTEFTPHSTVAYTIFTQGTPPTLACPLANTGTIGSFFSAQLIATGTGPFTFAVTGGALPPGLTLNATTGVISGIPQLQGPYSYTVTVTDANGLTAVVTCSIIITPPTGAAGRRPNPYIPNEFDNCLARDFRLYSTIDYERLGCAKLPACFKMDEREWGLPA
jgi:hypothetical protein